MNSLHTIQDRKLVNALWAGYPGMRICAALASRLGNKHLTFRSGPGGVKNIAD